MKLSKFLHEWFQGRNKPLKCDIVNCETGEVYFTGSIEFLWKDLISDKLEFVSFDQQNTIYFKEVRNMTKVVTKKEIEQVLFDGGKIRWTHWDAKASLLARSGVEVGTIRFNTYLQLDIREVEMKVPFYNPDGTINTECSPFTKLRRPDAWCGYDDFQLKQVVLEKFNDNPYFRKRIWRNKYYGIYSIR